MQCSAMHCNAMQCKTILPVVSKVFEKEIFRQVYGFLTENCMSQVSGINCMYQVSGIRVNMSVIMRSEK